MPISQVPFAGISNPVNFRNRIINGDMGIDQRNAGASVTAGTTKAYTLDRWFNVNSVTSKYTIQQNAASVTPPAGFVNYLGITSSAATTVNASDYYNITQNIEGLNVADLAWGTANAKTITLSFWVRSSLTGTFGGSLRNSAEIRSYPFTYSISSANTWEFKTITIAGDTSGTWLKTNGVGINLTFSLGTGSTYSGTANAWAGTNYASATSAVNVVSTNGATLYITGVQLEAGEQASGFEFMPIDVNLARCQRYCYAMFANQGGDNYTRYSVGETYTTTSSETHVPFPVNMRTRPSITTTGTASNYGVYTGDTVIACSTVPTISGGCSSFRGLINSVVASGFTVGRVGQVLSNNNTTSYLIFNAEL